MVNESQKDKKKGAHRILYKRGPEGEAIMPDEQTATDLGEQVVYLHAQLSDAQAEPQQVKERAEKTETALAEMTTRAETAEDTLTAERERHEKEFTDVAAQSERFRQGMVKAQNERNDLRDTVANLKVELVVAQEKIHGHEEWLKADSQYAKNQRLKAELAAARQEAVDLQAGFDLRWKADMRAIKAWQDSTGRKLVWPDHADLCVWLLSELAEARLDKELFDWLLGDCIGRKVYVRDVDEDTMKYTYSCMECLSGTPRGALKAARAKNRIVSRAETEDGCQVSVGGLVGDMEYTEQCDDRDEPLHGDRICQKLKGHDGPHAYCGHLWLKTQRGG